MPDSRAPSRVGMTLRALLGVVFGVALGGFAAHRLHVKPGDVLGYVERAPLWAVSFSVASAFVMFALQALRWHRVMKPVVDLPYGVAYRAQLVGMMLNAFLPARGGDFLRVQYLGRRTGKSRAAILGTEVVDRWLDFWGWIPLVAVLACVGHLPSWMLKTVAIFGAFLLSWAIAMIVLTRRGYEPRPGSRFGATYQSLRAGMNVFRSRRIWFIALVLAPLPWLWEAGVLMLVARAFSISLSLPMAFCLLVAFNVATVVPSPGAIGTLEAGGMAALAWFDVDHSRALAFLVTYHLAQLIPGILAGTTVLVVEGERILRPGAAGVG